MADELGIMDDLRNVDNIERQAPPRKVWTFMKKVREVAPLVAKRVFWKIPTQVFIAFMKKAWGVATVVLIVCWIVSGLLGGFCLVISRKWNWVFIVSCLAISLDPLFLYIPIIDEANQCLGIDQTLRNIVLVVRSIIDIVLIYHIVSLIFDEMEGPMSDDANVSESHQETSCSPLKSISIVISCLAIVPIPQVAILIVFFKMNGTNFFLIRSMINFALFFQFVVRIFQMYLSSKKIGKVANWVYGSLYFFLYILASHVFAAFWYFFSIQQVISCWYQTCPKSGVCIHDYNCGASTPNSKLLNGSCSISSLNATDFDFGMYIHILRSGNTGSISFPNKIFYYFWWGLKNLSNFGTNLETSSNVWENCFAITICITGLLLFLYLIGNVQLYIQMYMQRKAEKLAKMEEANHEFMENWMRSHGLHEYRKEIRRHISKALAWELSNKLIDTKFMMDSLSKIPREGTFSKHGPLDIVCVNALRKIPGLENTNKEYLPYFNSNYYHESIAKGRCIARAGEPIEAMWLIIDGVVIECKEAETTAPGSSPLTTLQTRNYFGVELLRWAVLNCKRAEPDKDPLPISPLTLTCQTDVIAFKFSRFYLEDVIRWMDNRNKLEEWALGLSKDSHADAAAAGLKRKKQEDILDWLSRNGVPPHLKTDITNCINEDSIVENNINAEVDVEFLFSLLQKKIIKSLRCHLGMNSLLKVPMLKSMHRYELEIICKHLKPVTYKNESYIVREGEVLGFMIFILQGTIILTRRNAITATSSEITEPSDEKILKEGDFHGEQLLRWASSNNISFSDHPVKSAVSVKCVTKVEALILKAEDLRSAVSKCGAEWNLNDCSSESNQLVGVGTDSVVDTSASVAGMTSTSNEQTIQLNHDILFQQLVLIRETMFQRFDDQGQRLDEMAAFLATMGYNGTSPPPPAT